MKSNLCKWFLLPVLTLLLGPLNSFSQGYVVMHEVLAANDNKSGDTNEINEFGHTSSWVELYNPTWDPVNLKGWFLIRGPLQYNQNYFITNASRFTFTNDLIIPGDCYLRLWCDQDNTNRFGLRDYHTGFALERTGDTISLVFPDSLTIGDTLIFGPQLSDFSIGLDPDYRYFRGLCIPTPSPANAPSTNLPNIVVTNLGSIYDMKINEWCPTNWQWWVEILKDPADTSSLHFHDDWIELYNPSTNPVALSWMTFPDALINGLILSTNKPGDLPLTPIFTPYTYIGPKGFLRFWAVGHQHRSYSADELPIKISFSLGETITLSCLNTNYDYVSIDSVSMPSEAVVPWILTNRITNVFFEGFTLTTNVNTNYLFSTQGRFPDGSTNIVMFPYIAATPGQPNYLPLTNAVINEILANSDMPLQDAVEIYNPSTTETIDLGGYWLSNSKNDPQKYRIPPYTIIGPLGYRVFYEWQFNPDWTGTNRAFSFNGARGDGCYIFGADGTGNLTGYRSGVEFGASENGVSFGRYVNSLGATEMVPMAGLSFGSSINKTSPPTAINSNAFVHGLGEANSQPKVGPIIISEVFCGPNVDWWEEYIELYNMSTNVVRLCDTSALPNVWNIQGTVDYAFQSGLSLAPGQFMVMVSADPEDAYLTVPRGFTNIFGPYGDLMRRYDGEDWHRYYVGLSQDSGTIELFKPDSPLAFPNPDAGFVPEILVDKFHYRIQGPTGRNSALQRILPESYGNEPTNWCAAVSSPGRPKNWRFHSITRANDTVTLRFSNVWAGTGFTVQYTDLLNGLSTTWTKLTDVPPQETTGWRTITDVVPAEAKRFYRIVTPIE